MGPARKRKVPDRRAGSIMGQDWISTFSPDLVVCDRCGARTNIGKTVRESLPGAVGIDRTRLWNWAVQIFADNHRSCKEVK